MFFRGFTWLSLVISASAKKHPKLDTKITEYKITSVSPLIVKNNDVVTVSFETNSPLIGDFIAAFSPANVDVNTYAPIAYGDCSHSVGYMTTGKGELSFEMTTLSSDVAFYYFIGSTGFFNMTYPGVAWGTPTTSVVSMYPEVIQFEDLDEPIRIRIIPNGSTSCIPILSIFLFYPLTYFDIILCIYVCDCYPQMTKSTV